eukprot:1065831-Pelagomonas_calceolata.AAC.6
MAQSHEVAVSGRTSNAKKEHIWGFAQIAPSGKIGAQRTRPAWTLFKDDIQQSRAAQSLWDMS